MTDDEKAHRCVVIARQTLARAGAEPASLEIEKLALQYMETFSDEKVEVEYASTQRQSPSRSAVVVRYAKTHEGRIAIADAIHTERLAEGEVARALRPHPKLLEEIHSLIRNPCSCCDSVRLEVGWAGTGYCSLACCDKVRQTGNDRAKQYAEGIYNDWLFGNQ